MALPQSSPARHGLFAAVRAKLRLASHVFASLRRRGPWRTIKIVLFELYYERKFSVKTGYVIPARELGGDPDALAHSSDYFPSSYFILREVFCSGSVDYKDRVVVDYGCGLGRALMFFSTLPCKRIVGIELSSSLAAGAVANLTALYRRRGKTTPQWEVITGDARRFAVPDDATVFYFFNPFDASVLRDVIGKIAESARRVPRRCTIVYANPVHREALSRLGLRPLPSPSPDAALFALE